MTMMTGEGGGMTIPSMDYSELSRALAAYGDSRGFAEPRALAEVPTTVTATAIPASQRLLQRATMGFSQTEQQRLEQLGYTGWLEEQLDYESIDNSELEGILADTLPTLSMSAADLYRDYYEQNPFQPVSELWIAAIARAIYSPRLLFERMAVLWSDHFSIDIFADFQNFLKPPDDREVVRSHALGRFPDLLSASAHSPAMLLFLTNNTNHKDHPNENYARELLELHSYGQDRGYNETDVKELARCLTGWTLWGLDSAELGTFRFDAGIHDREAKSVLGQQVPSGGGEDDGQMVIDQLGRSSRTAHFVARKLLTAFWGYKPPANMVSTVANRYLKTGGDIRAMMRLVLSETRMTTARDKLKRPFHLMVSAIRAVQPEVNDWGFFVRSLDVMGHLPFAWTPPDGYPDRVDYWSGFVLSRWNTTRAMANRNESGVEIRRNDLFNPGVGRATVIDNIDWLITNGTLSNTTRAELRGYLDGGTYDRRRVNQTIGLALSSPEFQHY